MTKELEIKLAADLTMAMLGVELSEMRFKNLNIALAPQYSMKRKFADWQKMMERIKREFRMEFDTIKDYQDANTEILNPEVTLQIEAINTMLLSIPKDRRDEVEAIVEKYYKQYKIEF